jgi:hypothetical protein
MLIKQSPQAEIANRWFRRGALAGAIIGFVVPAMDAALALPRVYRDQTARDLGFYELSFVACAALCVVGAAVGALIGGAVAIVAAKVVCRKTR